MKIVYFWPSVNNAIDDCNVYICINTTDILVLVWKSYKVNLIV